MAGTPEIHVAVLPIRHSVIAPLVRLLIEGKEVFFQTPHFALEAKRAFACSCFAARAMLHEHLHAEILHVQPTDATWANAVFVARLPNLQTLRVAGELHLPEMHLAHYKTLPRLRVGLLGPPAALFFGAAVARCDATLRLSDGSTCRSLKGIREQPLAILPQTASAADCLALLGALSLNSVARTCHANVDCGGIGGNPTLRAAWRAVFVTESALWEYTHAQILGAFAKPGFPLELIRQNWGWMDDRELARAAIENVSPHALEYAPEILRADREIILAAVALDGGALRYAVEELRGDRELVLVAISNAKVDACPLAHASAECCNDPELVHAAGLKAHQRSRCAYQYASAELMATREFVLDAVSICGHALAYAAMPLRADYEVALRAVAQDMNAFLYVAGALPESREFVLEAMSASPDHQAHERNLPIFEYVNVTLRGDRAIALAAVARDPQSIEYITGDLPQDRQFMLDAVRANGRAFKYVAHQLRADRSFVLEAVRVNGNLINQINGTFRADREIVIAAVNENGEALRFAITEMLADREVVSTAVREASLRHPRRGNRSMGPCALMYATRALRKDVGLIALAGGVAALSHYGLLGSDGSCLSGWLGVNGSERYVNGYLHTIGE